MAEEKEFNDVLWFLSSKGIIKYEAVIEIKLGENIDISGLSTRSDEC